MDSKKESENNRSQKEIMYEIDLTLNKIEQSIDKLTKIAYDLKQTVKGSVDIKAFPESPVKCSEELDIAYRELMKDT